jgi:hypothetical protein
MGEVDSFIHQYSALRPVRQEPELNQATDTALAHCIMGKFLGLGCYYIPPEKWIYDIKFRCH